MPYPFIELTFVHSYNHYIYFENIKRFFFFLSSMKLQVLQSYIFYTNTIQQFDQLNCYDMLIQYLYFLIFYVFQRRLRKFSVLLCLSNTNNIIVLEQFHVNIYDLTKTRYLLSNVGLCPSSCSMSVMVRTQGNY